jgi:hypothetical protein
MPLKLGEPAPWFTAPTPSNPEFVFDTAAASGSSLGRKAIRT